MTLPIWIVEDDEDDIEFYKECLTEITPQSELVIFTTAEKALRQLDVDQVSLPRLIIVDGHLPGMEGPKLVSILLKHPKAANYKVVMIAGTLSATAMQEVKDMGVEVHLKPDSLTILSEILGKIVRSI